MDENDDDEDDNGDGEAGANDMARALAERQKMLSENLKSHGPTIKLFRTALMKPWPPMDRVEDRMSTLEDDDASGGLETEKRPDSNKPTLTNQTRPESSKRAKTVA